MAERWRAALARRKNETRAADLYVGRAFSLAKQAASQVAGPLYVVYAAWVSSRPTSVWRPRLRPFSIQCGWPVRSMRLSKHGATWSDWWQLLCGGEGLASLVANARASIALIALPSGYLRMVEPDLARMESAGSWATTNL